MEEQSGATVEFKRRGRGAKFDVFVMVDGALVFSDAADIACAKTRQKVVADLVNRFPSLDAVSIEDGMIKALTTKDRDEGQAASFTEMNGKLIMIRPDRFILPAASGVAVSIPGFDENGQFRTEERYAIAHATGERELIPVAQFNKLGEKDILVAPEPSISLPDLVNAWPTDAIKRWAEGEQAPTLAAVLQTLAELFNETVKFPSFTRDDEQDSDDWEQSDQRVWSAVLSIFTILTYVSPALPTVPYLRLLAPPNSGKSRLLEVLQRLCFRPLKASSISAAAVFRTLHDRGGVLLVDEADHLHSEDSVEILKILNAGYKQSSAWVHRIEATSDKRFVTRQYFCFGPKIIATTNPNMPSTLGSRCITVAMMRSKDTRYQQVLGSDEEDPRWPTARAACYAFVLDSGPRWIAVGRQRQFDDIDLSGREAETWSPILATARWYDTETGGNLTAAIADLVGLCRDVQLVEPFTEKQLLVIRELAGLLHTGKQPQCRDILDACRVRDRETSRGLTERGVSAILKAIGIHTHPGKRPVYRPADLKRLRQVARRYDMDLGLEDGK